MLRLYASVLILFSAANLISTREPRSVDDCEDYGSPPMRSLHDRRLFRVDRNTFNYYDPGTWGNTFPACYGLYQSPINVDTDKFEHREIKRSLKWRNMEKLPSRMILEKSDIVLDLKPEWKNARDIPRLTGGPLNETYYFYNVHLHWDFSSDSGSEHAVNGKRFPMEMHAVYTSNPEGIITTKDRILVTAFMVTISNNYNPAFEPIISALPKRNDGSAIEIPIKPFPLKQMGLSFCAHYVIYSGSLTTPPCTQGVTWIISAEPVKMSWKQYDQLRNSLDAPDSSARSNNRPLQQLNGRKVFHVVPPPCKPNNKVMQSRSRSPFTKMMKHQAQAG